jgi:serine/threonine-protein kinase RsbW
VSDDSAVPIAGQPPQVDQPADKQVDDVVELRLPADSAYLSVLRTATAGLAARLDFTLDEIEDLRIAVDEACAMLLPDAVAGASLVCHFAMSPESLAITVSVPTRGGRLPRRNTFAWTVLTSLAGEVDAQAAPDGTVSVRLTKRREGRA